MAWWHAVPKPPPSKSKKPPKQLPERRSRLTVRIEAGGEPDLPDVEPALLFIVDCLFDAGPTSVGGMGSVPLTWADIAAWERSTGVVLQPWQARTMRALSSEYLAESLTADEHDAPPPWKREVDAERRSLVATHIKNVLRG